MAQRAFKVCRRLSSRRMVLLGTAASVAIHSAVAAEEQEKEAPRTYEVFKASKEAAGYFQKTEPSAQECGTCHLFIGPDECLLVEGPVSPLGWCSWYAD